MKKKNTSDTLSIQLDLRLLLIVSIQRDLRLLLIAFGAYNIAFSTVRNLEPGL